MKAAQEIEKTVFEIAVEFGFTEEELKSRKKTRPLADMKKIIISALREKTDLSTKRIGDVLNLSHSNVCVQTVNHQNLMDTSKIYNDRYSNFCQIFDSKVGINRASSNKVEVTS